MPRNAVVSRVECDLGASVQLKRHLRTVLLCLGGRLRRSQLIGLDLGGRLCTYDGDDGACPIAVWRRTAYVL